MAAGIYNTDLTDISLCESTTGFSALGGGGAGLAAGPDFAIQGTNAVDKSVSNSLKGIVYDNGSTITLGADEHILIWEICATPGITSIQSLGGVRISIGTATNAYYEWYVNGSDTLPAGGIINYAIYYTGSTASNTVGSPGASPQVFGGQADVNATAKGVNFGLDAIRYGTGFYLTAGDATEPINFDSASLVNDSNTNRYGILSSAIGGYALKGRFVVGQNNTFTPTQAYFDASNTNVSFIDTPFTKTDFTQIIVDHPSTFFKISSVNFTGTGTNNPGQIVFNDSSTTGSILGCNFNTIGKTFLQANVSTTGSSFNSTDTVFQSGSNLFDSTFRTTTGVSSSILVTDPSKLSFNTLDNEGSKHGVEVISTGSYVFEANIFSNFDSGSNANEALYFNPTGGTGDLTLQIIGGGTTVDFRNASSGTVTIENNASITVTGLQDNTEVRIFDSATTGPQTELAGIEDAIDGTSGNRSFTFTLPVGTIVDIVLISVQYENDRLDDFEITISQDLPFEQTFDRNYSNPDEGVITALFNSLQSRSTYYENETESKTFVENLDNLGLLESASLLYPAAGVSVGLIHSLIPSSSVYDLSGSNLPTNDKLTVKINSSGYVVTQSLDNIPKITYDPLNVGELGALSFYRRNTSGATRWARPITWAVNGSSWWNSGDTTPTQINTTLTYPASGITSIDGLENATLLSDDGSTGTKEVKLNWGSVNLLNFSPSAGYISLWASGSGANYLYISQSNPSAVASQSAQWFDLANRTTGSFQGDQHTLLGSNLYRDGWTKYTFGVSTSQPNDPNMTMSIGISDNDLGSTVTADGTNKVYLWGVSTDIPTGVGDQVATRPLTIDEGNGWENANTWLYSAKEAFPPTQEFSLYVEGEISTLGDFTIPSSGVGNPSYGLRILVGVSGSTTTGTRIEILNADSDTLNSTIFATSISAPSFGGVRYTSPSLPTTPWRNLNKIAYRVKNGDHKVFVNGVQAIASTAIFGTAPFYESIYISPKNPDTWARIRNLTIFDQPLSDAELISLTS